MNIDAFESSVSGNTPPAGSSVYLRALWYDAKDDWEKAHELVNDLGGEQAAWVHAYLHRKEGDLANAQYWYSRAGKQMPGISLAEEWRLIASALL